ncbi:hypothetical protein FGB62_207g010 [Gracilaria domingensis]|nr:hypothetical protein FGB62_207g010 [Gracilaria domingensis]
MDSGRDCGRQVYDSIPPHPAAHISLRDGLGDHLSRVARSSSTTRLLKAVAVLTFSVVSVLVFSSIWNSRSVDHPIVKSRIYELAPNRLPVSQRYAYRYLPYFRSYKTRILDSLGRYESTALPRFSSPSLAYLSRQDLVSQPEVGFVIEEFVNTGKCSARRVCRARLIVTKDEDGVKVEAGFDISSLKGRDPITVDRGTKGRVGAIRLAELRRWVDQLLRSVSEELAGLDCLVSSDALLQAIGITLRFALRCPKTDDPLCHQLFTVRECPHEAVPPTPTPVPKESCEVAFDECEFTFDGESELATFSIDGPPDKSFTPVVVAKDPDVHLGTLNSNNVVPEFIEDDGAFPITDFGSQPFAPTQFKPYYIWQEQGSGIGHQTFHGDQQELSRGRCIRIFFTDIQLKDPASNLNHVPRSENKCVVFRTD